MSAVPLEIVYYTDPLCCWSWAMEESWIRLRKEYTGKISWRYCMGGLLPDWNNFHDALNGVTRPVQMGPVWMEAAHISNTAINSMIWIKDPPASSYLSCIAVKCAKLQSAEAEEKYLRRLRAAVMEKGINIAPASALLTIASELADEEPAVLDAKLFAAELTNGRGKQAFTQDLDEVQRLQINRFPTFVCKSEGQRALLLIGFRPYDVLAAAVEKMLSATVKNKQVV
jgi:predicted DsbA family dithiol-disulfide isomerase